MSAGPAVTWTRETLLAEARRIHDEEGCGRCSPKYPLSCSRLVQVILSLGQEARP